MDNAAGSGSSSCWSTADGWHVETNDSLIFAFARGLHKPLAGDDGRAFGEELRETRTEGFARAMNAMSENLAIELNKLEFRIKEDPTVAQVTPRAGSGGGGVFSLYLILLLAATVIMARQEG